MSKKLVAVIFTVVGLNVLADETDDEAIDVTVPVAEWMSAIITSNSRKACLLFDFYVNKNVFRYVSFEMIYRSADDAETVEKKLLFSVSNDGVADRVADVFELSLDYDVSQYQVSLVVAVSLKALSLCI